MPPWQAPRRAEARRKGGSEKRTEHEAKIHYATAFRKYGAEEGFRTCRVFPKRPEGGFIPAQLSDDARTPEWEGCRDDPRPPRRPKREDIERGEDDGGHSPGPAP